MTKGDVNVQFVLRAATGAQVLGSEMICRIESLGDFRYIGMNSSAARLSVDVASEG